MPLKHGVSARRGRRGHAFRAGGRAGSGETSPTPAPSPTPGPPAPPEPAPTLPAPSTELVSAPTAYPPRIAVDLGAEHGVGDRLRIRVAEDVGFTRRRMDEAIVLTGDLAANGAALNARLAGIKNGTGYIDVRIERGGAVGFRSTPLLYGTSAVPAITSPTAFANVETRPLLVVVELDGTGFLFLGGQDADRFELVDAAQPGTRFQLRYLGDATKDFDQPDDWDRDGVYDLDLVVQGLNGVEATRAATVRLLDLDTVPDDFVLPALTGVTRSTVHAAPIVTVSGLAPGYAAPVTASHPYVKNGGAPTGAGGTAANGDRLSFPPVLSSADHATTVERRLTIGPISRVFSVTTEAAPAATAWVPSTAAPVLRNLGFSTAVARFEGMDFEAGLAVVFVAPHGAGRDVTGVAVGGVAATRRPATAAGGEASAWTAPVATAGAKDVLITYNAAPAEVGIATGTVLRAGSAEPSSVAHLDSGYRYSPPHRTASALDVPDSGVGVLFAYHGDGGEFSYVPGLTATSAGPKLGTAVVTGSLAPGILSPNGFVALLALSWRPAA